VTGENGKSDWDAALLRLEEEQQRRKFFRDSVPLSVFMGGDIQIVTGVPRAPNFSDNNVAPAEEPASSFQSQPEPPQRRDYTQPLPPRPRLDTSTMQRVEVVTVDGADAGVADQTAVGHFIVIDNAVHLTDAAGKFLCDEPYKTTINVGETAAECAKKLLSRRLGVGGNGFDRGRLSYFNPKL